MHGALRRPLLEEKLIRLKFKGKEPRPADLLGRHWSSIGTGVMGWEPAGSRLCEIGIKVEVKVTEQMEAF